METTSGELDQQATDGLTKVYRVMGVLADGTEVDEDFTSSTEAQEYASQLLGTYDGPDGWLEVNTEWRRPANNRPRPPPPSL